MNKKVFFIIFLIPLLIPITYAEECTPKWSCTEFSVCREGFETRLCIDLNECEGAVVPELAKGCLLEEPLIGGCTPKWECTDWSKCSVGGSRYRFCNDNQRCDTEEGKPLEDQACSEGGLRPVNVFLLILFLVLLLLLLLAMKHLRHLKHKVREEERTFFIPEHSPGHDGKKQA